MRTRPTASRRRPRLGLTGKLPGRARLQTLYTVAAATLAAIVPLVVFAGFWIRSELTKSQHDIDAFLNAQSRALSYRIDAGIREQISALKALASLESLDDGSFESFGKGVKGVLAVTPSWSVVGLIDPQTGEHVFSQGGSWSARDERAVVRQVVDTRQATVSAHSGGSAGQDDVLLYVPALRNGAVRFVAVAAVRVPEIRDVAARESPDGLVLCVIGQDDQILAQSRVAGYEVGPEVGREVQQISRAVPEGLYESGAAAVPSFGAYVRSPLTGWVSLVSMSRKQLDANARRSTWATIAAIALSVILFAILGVFLFHTVMERRVSNERLAASEALGDLDARLLATTQEALDEQRKASSEREILLREIYHRVKNNLQIVQSLLRLGSRELKPEQREPFESAVRRIGAMARVHTLLYNSPDLASIDFKDYLDELLRELSEGFAAEERSIEHVLTAHSLRLPLDTAVPLAFIAVEILTNAYRHAFPEGGPGRISVTAHRSDGTGTLRIEDTGIGITIDQTTKRRLGLTIVGKLVQQIGGTLEGPEPGSSAFTISFPMEPEDGKAAGSEPFSRPVPAETGLS